MSEDRQDTDFFSRDINARLFEKVLNSKLECMGNTSDQKPRRFVRD